MSTLGLDIGADMKTGGQTVLANDRNGGRLWLITSHDDDDDDDENSRVITSK